MPNYINKPRPRNRTGNTDGFIMPTSKRHLPTIGSNHLSQTSATNINIADMPKPPSLTQTGKPNQQADSLIGKTIPGTISSTAKAYQPPLGHNSTQTKIKTRRFGRRNSKKWTWKRWLVVPTVIIIIIALGFVGWDIWQLDHKVNHLAVGNLTASVGGAENILVAGSTNRCNLTVQNAEWGFCSQGVTGVNSDIIFIVHIVPKTHAVSLLSIPRDTFVPNARAGDEAFKIDAALYEGPTQLVKAVEEDFGIPIQHYVEVGFDGFVNIVNAVGGIKMDFPMPVYDSESYLNIKTPGCQLLNGVQALQVVRARHLQYDPPGLDTSDKNLWPQEAESDIARIARTHEFLRVLASTIAAKGIGNPITDQKLIDAIAPQVQVDSGLSTSAMLQLAQEFHTVNINNVPQYTLPISTTTFSNYVYDGTAYGDVVFPVEATDQQVINEFLGTSNATDTMTGKPLPSPPAVTVKVVNGSGIPDQAAQTATALQALGFDVIGQPGSATPLSDEAVETVVSYASPSTEADAEAVARQLTGPVILSQNASLATSGSEVTVLTGTGLAVNAPANSSTPSTPNTSNSANTTTVTGLEPASSATLPLSAWDPRACTE